MKFHHEAVARRAFPVTIPLALRTCLVVVGAALAAFPASGEILLEPEAGAVRLWSAEGLTARVPHPESVRPRTAIRAEEGVIVAGVDRADGELAFLHQTGGRTTVLPPPSSRVGERAWPVLLQAGDRLEGAIWLEGTGPDHFAIQAAVWNGSSFEEVETVSPPRGRAQLAPSGVVLEDGSWLVVWAGFDGEDDEIYWSRRTYGSWSAPRRLHADNRVPDILPAVTADGPGARAAWSFFDGNDYRLATASFDGRRWRVETALEGVGAVRAGWDRQDGRLFVTYHSVAPDGWTVLELGEGGVVLHKALLEADASRRPLVSAGNGGPPRLFLPRSSGGSRRVDR